MPQIAIMAGGKTALMSDGNQLLQVGLPVSYCWNSDLMQGSAQTGWCRHLGCIPPGLTIDHTANLEVRLSNTEVIV